MGLESGKQNAKKPRWMSNITLTPKLKTTQGHLNYRKQILIRKSTLLKPKHNWLMSFKPQRSNKKLEEKKKSLCPQSSYPLKPSLAKFKLLRKARERKQLKLLVLRLKGFV